MIFRITHTTRYDYSQPVFLEPHQLRLRPRSDGTQRVNQFALRIEPEPVSLTEALDAEGNALTNVHFAGTTQQLLIEMQCEVETLRTNPFDFIPANGRTVEFLTGFARNIHETYQTELREFGEPHPVAVTEQRRAGTCRDLAVLFIESCREEGWPARFVSGYHVTANSPHHLHAWAEVLVPGGGWRGFDPTEGLAVGDRHVVVAAASKPRDAAPVIGAFRGTGAQSQMQVAIQLTAA